MLVEFGFRAMSIPKKFESFSARYDFRILIKLVILINFVFFHTRGTCKFQDNSILSNLQPLRIFWMELTSSIQNSSQASKRMWKVVVSLDFVSPTFTEVIPFFNYFLYIKTTIKILFAARNQLSSSTRAYKNDSTDLQNKILKLFSSRKQTLNLSHIHFELINTIFLLISFR